MMIFAEPCGLGARIAETREATGNLWGRAGVTDVLERVSSDVRDAFSVGAKLPRWVPERFFVGWMTSVWEGPCKEEHETFLRWADEVTNCGFGRARKLVLSLASPWLILRRAGALWRGEHSHGKLVVARLGESRARMSLSEHPFVDTEISRAAISEAFRHILVLSRAGDARETHEFSHGLLHVTVNWT